MKWTNNLEKFSTSEIPTLRNGLKMARYNSQELVNVRIKHMYSSLIVLNKGIGQINGFL